MQISRTDLKNKERRYEQLATSIPTTTQFNALLTRLCLMLATCACMTFTAVSASAQLADNQTNGFGNNRLATLTYLQNFDCVDQPRLGSPSYLSEAMLCIKG
jgi:hypothetical protein